MLALLCAAFSAVFLAFLSSYFLQRALALPYIPPNTSIAGIAPPIPAYFRRTCTILAHITQTIHISAFICLPHIRIYDLRSAVATELAAFDQFVAALPAKFNLRRSAWQFLMFNNLRLKGSWCNHWLIYRGHGLTFPIKISTGRRTVTIKSVVATLQVQVKHIEGNEWDIEEQPPCSGLIDIVQSSDLNTSSRTDRDQQICKSHISIVKRNRG